MKETGVPWTVFVWSAGIVTVLIGSLFAQNMAISKQLNDEKDARISGDAVQLQLSNDMKVQYATIQAQLTDIKEQQLELKAQIKTIR